MPLPGGVYFVRELRIGELIDLQEWVSAVARPPWDVPESDDPEAVAGAMHVLSRDWPPRVDTGDAEKAVGSVAWNGRLLSVSPGLPEPESVAMAAELDGPEWSAVRSILRGAWFGIRPIDSAARLLQQMSNGGDGSYDDPGEPLDWPKTVTKLCEVYPGLNPTVIRGLTLSEFRTLCDRGDGREIEYTRADLPKAAAIRAKGVSLLSSANHPKT